MHTMKGEKEISFTEFFKEDIFKNEEPAIETVEDIRKPEKAIIPHLSESVPASENETREYWKKLRTFFLTGENFSENRGFSPALLAPYLNGQAPEMDYPFCITSPKSKYGLSVKDFLFGIFNDLFAENEAILLRKLLPNLVNIIRGRLSSGTTSSDFGIVVMEAISELKKIEIKGDEASQFREQLVKYQMALQNISSTLIPFAHTTLFLLLNEQIRVCKADRQVFLDLLKKKMLSLQEMLMVEDEKNPEKSSSQFGIGMGMIQFDKLSGMIPPSATKGLSEDRMKRIADCVERLKKAESFILNQSDTVYVSADFSSRLGLRTALTNASVEETETPCKLALAKCQKQRSEFASFIAALRIAELEISDKYDEQIHGQYFRTFTYERMSEEEISIMPLHIVVDMASQLMTTSLSQFSEVLSGNFPVKIISLNALEDLSQTSHASAGGYRQEIASLAISYRSPYIFQGSYDTPLLLNQSYAEGLVSSTPAVWNVLYAIQTDTTLHYVSLYAAIEGRYFPRFTYNPSIGERLGSRFDINQNPQPEKLMPVHDLEVKSESGTNKIRIALSPLDFELLSVSNTLSMEVLDAAHDTDDLMYITDYLNAAHENLIGKIPFIWVSDANARLYKAAVAFRNVSVCKERIDFWQFVQELGGVNSYHVQRAIAVAQEEWDQEKATEMAIREQTHAEEIERLRREEAGLAMDRLAGLLLDLDSWDVAPNSGRPSKPVVASTPIVQTESSPVPAPAEEEESLVSSEVWVETFRCTSCNECIEKLPSVFKYNGDKQAFVQDPSKGTFAQIVTVAEKCPAKCIHPGKPQNPNEQGLDDLIKRAEALN